MKKQKLSLEEKEELKKDRRAWSDMIRIAKRKGALISESK